MVRQAQAADGLIEVIAILFIAGHADQAVGEFWKIRKEPRRHFHRVQLAFVMGQPGYRHELRPGIGWKRGRSSRVGRKS